MSEKKRTFFLHEEGPVCSMEERSKRGGEGFF